MLFWLCFGSALVFGCVVRVRFGGHLAFCSHLFSNTWESQTKTIRFDDRLSLERAPHELKKNRYLEFVFAGATFECSFCRVSESFVRLCVYV